MVYLIWLIYLLIGSWTPWWSSLAIAFVAGAISKSRGNAMVVGFGGGFLIWLLITGYFNYSGHDIVAKKLGMLFGGLPSFGFHVVVSTIAGLLHAFIAVCGFEFRSSLSLKPSLSETSSKSES